MPDILNTLKRRMQQVRRELRQNRAQIIAEAAKLFDAGLERDEVYLEIRERYLEAIPVIAESADRAVDWSALLPGVGGDLLEAIDGKVVDTLLRLAVQAADRRRERKKRGIVTLGDALRRAPLRDITPAPEPDDDAPSRSGALADLDGLDAPI